VPLTYAQKCVAPRKALTIRRHFATKPIADRKLLIHMILELCFFDGQSSESLDFQGFGEGGDKISTKLSTENLDEVQNTYGSST
jgi:hypothetical protein